ncbi:MAG TPA: hypothetical protein VJ204_10880 [Solirubrobacterales bacterium]|nr:hypothetical protein [Solirubrobacterales bacterium]
MRRLVIVFLAAGLLAAGCGGGSDHPLPSTMVSTPDHPAATRALTVDQTVPPAKVIGRCPKKLTEFEGVRIVPGTVGHAVAPHPTGGLLCLEEFVGAVGKVSRKSSKLHGTPLSNLAGLLNSLPKVQVLGESEGCGGGPEVYYLIALDYAGGSQVQFFATVKEACASVTDLTSGESFSTSYRLEKLLGQLVG